MANEKNRSIINKEYKDRLFKLIFLEKENLLELYNAVNGTEYDNPEEIEVNVIEDAVYMGMKNDVSFLVKDVLNLYEHQSTFSSNMPLRGLFYFADLYRKMIGNSRDIYSSKLISLPFPQFLVFYNGTRKEPERQVLELKDAFPEGSVAEEASLQCRAVMLNINLGCNAELMEKCKKLKEYAQLVSMVREYLAEGKSIKEAVDHAVEDCIRENILRELLCDHREEVCGMLLYEYDEQAHIESEKEIARAEGLEQGEELFAVLTEKLIRESRMEDLLKATTDKVFRKKLYEEYGMKIK